MLNYSDTLCYSQERLAAGCSDSDAATVLAVWMSDMWSPHPSVVPAVGMHKTGLLLQCIAIEDCNIKRVMPASQGHNTSHVFASRWLEAL